MAVNKPSHLSSKLWAKIGNMEQPDDVKMDSGWAAEIPKSQIENWVQNRQDRAIGHYNERGIAEWDITTDYLAGKSYVQGSNGVIYRAKQNTGPSSVPENPVDDVTNDYWEVPFQDRLVSATNIKTVNGENLLGSGNIIISGGGGTVPNATTEIAGVVELATNAEAIAGTDTNRAVTPEGLKSFLNADETKQDANVNLSALSSLIGTPNGVPYFTAPGAMDLVAISSTAAEFISKNSVEDARDFLEAAPIDSPQFTGIATAPTPDGSVAAQLATVDYVDSSVSDVAGTSVVTMTTSGTVTLGNIRSALILVDASAASISLTLPLNNGTLGVRDLVFKKTDSSGNTVTVSVSGSDTIQTRTTSKTSFVLDNQGYSVAIRSDGAGRWWESSTASSASESVEGQVLLATQADAEPATIGAANNTKSATILRVFQALRSAPAKSAIVDAVRPVGSHYIQFAETDGTFASAKSPSALFGGTWSLKFNTESVYFRTEGTLAAAGRSSGVQGDAIRNITGTLSNVQKQATSGFIATGAFGLRPDIYESAGNASGASPARAIDIDASRVVPTADEVRTKNRLIRVWERTA